MIRIISDSAASLMDAQTICALLCEDCAQNITHNGAKHRTINALLMAAKTVKYQKAFAQHTTRAYKSLGIQDRMSLFARIAAERFITTYGKSIALSHASSDPTKTPSAKKSILKNSNAASLRNMEHIACIAIKFLPIRLEQKIEERRSYRLSFAQNNVLLKEKS